MRLSSVMPGSPQPKTTGRSTAISTGSTPRSLVCRLLESGGSWKLDQKPLALGVRCFGCHPIDLAPLLQAVCHGLDRSDLLFVAVSLFASGKVPGLVVKKHGREDAILGQEDHILILWNK